MRKLALLTLSIYLSLLWTPIALAAGDDTVEKIQTEYGTSSLCKIGNSNASIDITIFELVDDEGKTRQEIMSEEITKFTQNLAEHIKGAKCGEAKNKFFEKGACKDEVVTEVTESFAPSIKSENGQILDVYAGLCCLIYEKEGEGEKANYTCQESRTIYTEDFSTCNGNAILCEKRQWIIGKSGAGIIKLYVKQIYSWGAGTAGFIAVIVIIASGIQIQLSGISGDISQAKDRILQSLSGLVLIFLSGIILYTINPGFFS